MRSLLPWIAVALLAGCEAPTIPNYNAPGVETMTQRPDARTVDAAVLGLVAKHRNSTPTYALRLGILGREVLFLTSFEERNLTEMLVEPLTPGAIIIGMGWGDTFSTLLAGRVLMDIAQRAPNYTADQRHGALGVAQTIMAIALMDQIRVRDTFGIVVDVDPTGRRLGEFVSRDSGWAVARALLDEAYEHLRTTGATFRFTLPTGYSGFNTAGGFARYNRAITARLEIYRGNWQAALDALAESFISTADASRAGLDRGVYHTYAAGEATHGLSDALPASLVAVPSFLNEARLRPDATRDLRATAKAQVVATPVALLGVSSNLRVTRYATNTAPVPVIRNEELVLMRAEASWQLGQRASAIADLNFVRVNSGGLAPLPADFSGDFVTELLYDRQFSLFFEHGHRWVDARRYGRLDQLPRAVATHRIFPLVPLPLAECNARGWRPAGCVQVNGL